MLAHIDRQLDVWGRHFGHSVRKELGISSTTIIGKLMDQGPGASAMSSRMMPDNPTADRIEAAVIMMPTHLRKAVMLRHVAGYNDPMAARSMRISVPTYRLHMNMSHYWLDGYLRAMK